MDAFITKLRSNAYDTLDISAHTVDLQGWMEKTFVATLERIIAPLSVTQPLTILEVGSWKGLSATTMAATVKRLGFTKTNLIAIDTWLGAPEFWTWGLNDPTRGGSFNLKDGYPTIFYTFTRNVKALGHHDVIAPLPISSTQAADVLAAYKIQADLAYIDAAHEYDSVHLDLVKYWPLVKPGGSLFGDDYDASWPGVMKAVNDFAKEKGVIPVIAGFVWILKKPV
jgi:hypothetical protein